MEELDKLAALFPRNTREAFMEMLRGNREQYDARDSIYAGGLQGTSFSRMPHDEYWIHVTSDQDIPHYSIFGIQSADIPLSNPDSEVVRVAQFDSSKPNSPLALLTNGSYSIDGTGTDASGRARFINDYSPCRLAIDSGSSLADFKIGHPCGPTDGSWGVQPDAPGFICLGALSGDGAEGIDSILCARTRDDSFIGKVDGSSIGTASGDTPASGKARINWLQGAGSGMPSLVDALNPDTSGGSGDEKFILPVLNFSPSISFSDGDLVAICPIVGVGYAIAKIC